MVSRLMDDRARSAIADSIRSRRVDVRGALFKSLLQSALVLTLLILAVLLVTVLTDSWAQIGGRLGDFLSGTLRSRSSDGGLGVNQGIYGSLWIAVIVAVLAFPTGIGAAIYLEEYAPRNRFTSFVEVNIRNLAGVPSVVYGLLGLAILVKRRPLRARPADRRALHPVGGDHPGRAGAAHRDHHLRRGVPGRAQRAAGGGLRGGGPPAGR